MRFKEYITEVKWKKEPTIKEQKAKLQKAIKKIPAKYRKDAKYELIKDGRQESSYHSHGTIYIGDELVRYKYVNTWRQEEFKEKYPNEPNVIYESNNDYDLDKKYLEYSQQFLEHTVAHETGHYLYNVLYREHGGKKIKQKVGTKTVAAYSSWTKKKEREYGEEGGIIPVFIQEKMDKEKFAEMFRLYITEGKYKPFFKKIDKEIGK